MQKRRWKLDREVQYVVGQQDSKPLYLRLPAGSIITEVSSSAVPVEERSALNHIVNENRAKGHKTIIHQLPHGRFTTLRIKNSVMLDGHDTDTAWWRR